MNRRGLLDSGRIRRFDMDFQAFLARTNNRTKLERVVLFSG